MKKTTKKVTKKKVEKDPLTICNEINTTINLIIEKNKERRALLESLLFWHDIAFFILVFISGLLIGGLMIK